jgi:hypothetical protein
MRTPDEEPSDDPKAKVLAELDPEAVELLIADEDQTVLPGTPLHNALGPLRLARRTAPNWTSERGSVYQVLMRREQAEELRGRCEALSEILETFPAEDDRNRGKVLARAVRAFAEAHLGQRGRRETRPAIMARIAVPHCRALDMELSLRGSRRSPSMIPITERTAMTHMHHGRWRSARGAPNANTTADLTFSRQSFPV